VTNGESYPQKRYNAFVMLKQQGKLPDKHRKEMLQQSLLNQLKKKLDIKKKSSKALSQMDLDLVLEPIPTRGGLLLGDKKIDCQYGSEIQG
jgi:hypothetical protein